MTPHMGHIHSRTESGKEVTRWPQSAQRLDEGYHWGATMSVEPYHRDLYFSIRRNCPQPTSAMCRTRWRLRTMPRTLRSSTTMTDLVFTSLVVVWCRKSM